MPVAVWQGCRRRDGATAPELAEGTELALEMLARALERDHLRAEWVAGDDAFGMSPSFRDGLADGLAALGMWYVLDVPGGTTLWPLEPAWTSPGYQGSGRPRKPGSGMGSAGAWSSAAMSCRVRPAGDNGGPGVPGSAELYVQRPEGAGHQETQARRRKPGDASPARRSGLSTAGTWTAANPVTICPTLPETRLWRPWRTWAVPGGA